MRVENQLRGASRARGMKDVGRIHVDDLDAGWPIGGRLGDFRPWMASSGPVGLGRLPTPTTCSTQWTALEYIDHELLLARFRDEILGSGSPQDPSDPLDWRSGINRH